jgi:hypothetical protein
LVQLHADSEHQEKKHAYRCGDELRQKNSATVSREQQELRTALGTLLSPSPVLTEEDLHRRLAAQGRLSVPSPAARSRSASRSFKPVPVWGQPVSETIMEERR